MVPARPWLSVLMPVLNGRDYIAEALESIAAQNDPDIECIVVDGGSSDGTVEAAKTFEGRLNTRIIERPDSANWVWSTNLAISLACAPLCSILHQDDFWLPERAAAMRALTETAPDVGFFVHDVCFVTSRGSRVGALTCPWPSFPRRIESESALAHLLVQNFISCPAPVFSTALARETGGLDNSLWYTADWDFWIRLLRRTPALYRNETLAAFRIHGVSQTIRQSRDVPAFRNQLDRVIDRHGEALQPRRVRDRITRTALFSNALNASLAARLHGHRIDWGPLVGQALALGPRGLACFLKNSRIFSRSLARLRAGVKVRDRTGPGITR